MGSSPNPLDFQVLVYQEPYTTCLQNWSTMVNFMRWPTLRLKMLVFWYPQRTLISIEPLKVYIKNGNSCGLCLLSQWTSSFLLNYRRCIGIQFESCKSVWYKTIFTLQFTKNGRRTESVEGAWKNRESEWKTPDFRVTLIREKTHLFLMPIAAHRLVAVHYIYPCFAMGVVENVLRKAKERTARASAKISGSNAIRFGRKIGIRSLLIKFKTWLYNIAILISSMGYIYICVPKPS